MEEIWKDIEGYEGLYQVSNLGNVKSLKAKRNLYYSNSNNGYLRVGLFKGTRKMFAIHRLVAKAFLPNPQHKKVVNHKDFDVKNNAVSNLEWCTFKENNNYGYHQIKKYISLVENKITKDFPNEKNIIQKIKDIKAFIGSK